MDHDHEMIGRTAAGQVRREPRRHSAEAIAALNESFKTFQSILPQPIITEVSTEAYDRLPQLIDVLRPYMDQCGLSFYWTDWEHALHGEGNQYMSGKCVLRHTMGYGQSAYFAIVDVHGTFADMPQPAFRIQSAVSMIQRITLENVCGISTWAPNVSRSPMPTSTAPVARQMDQEKLNKIMGLWKGFYPRLADETGCERGIRFWTWLGETLGQPCDESTQLTDEQLDQALAKLQEGQ